ncbi:MAG: AAA family ATPase [Thermoguttaceae bacterium]
MRITDLDVDGFGVWTGLRIQRLGDTINVFYGPNEAGKTTLLEFIRSILYGFSGERRRYLPPVHGGRGGGSIEVNGQHGRYRVSRHVTSDDGSPGERLLLDAADGTRQGEHFLGTLLSNVDDAVFNNVFAVGLREVQELATLSDTAAAEMLYSLTAGLDRVSLVEVLRELEASRNRILDATGGPCQAVQLLAEHEKLRVEIQEVATIGHRYGHLATERNQLHGEIVLLEEEANRTEQLERTLEAALAVYDPWRQRAALDEQLAAFGPPKTMPEDAIARLDALVAATEKHQRHVDELTETRVRLRREFAGLTVNDALWRQTARIEALKEQEPWIVQLKDTLVGLEGTISKLGEELAGEAQRLGLCNSDTAPAGAGSAVTVTWPSARTLASLRGPARQLRETQGRLNKSRQAADEAAANADTLAEQLRSGLAAHQQQDLTAALDQAGNVVLLLRRREQIEGRLNQLTRHQTELEDKNRELAERQLLPAGVLVGLGGIFVFGAVLILAGLLMPTTVTGSIGWTLAVLGLAGSGAAAFAKIMLERSNAAQLDACQQQIELLRSQIEQMTQERDAVDSQLPHGGGPTAVRLQAAERELAGLDGLTPLSARATTARQEAEATAQRVTEATDAARHAKHRWRAALVAAGLPETLALRQVRRLAAHADRIAQRQRDLASHQDELARRRQELDSLATRIEQLAADAGVPIAATSATAGRDPLAMLRTLVEAATAQQAAAARREALRRQSRTARRVQTKREEAIGRLRHRRKSLFIEAGVKSEQEFRQRALECARTGVLHQQREQISHEIEAALAGRCPETAIAEQIEANNRPVLEGRRRELQQRAAGVREQLAALLENRGRLNEQLDALAADNRMASKRLDLSVVERRIEDALHRWQVLAATCAVLDAIRTAYEKERQPETLQEASGYLDRLTQGRYIRVWTPLGEHVLRVDDAEGHSLPVESLSRGTREQLFLSLRLALAGLYSRRDASLPLVLDDVLVNFDADRAKAAAAVLRDFAAAGHQLLVFTCHEHILKLFKSLKAPVSRLPNNASPGPLVVQIEHPSEEKPKRERRPRQSRRAAVQEEPEVEEPNDDRPDETATAVIDQDGESLWEEDDSDEMGEE